MYSVVSHMIKCSPQRPKYSGKIKFDHTFLAVLNRKLNSCSLFCLSLPRLLTPFSANKSNVVKCPGPI